jgi:hypothetical protein
MLNHGPFFVIDILFGHAVSLHIACGIWDMGTDIFDRSNNKSFELLVGSDCLRSQAS